MNKINYNKIMEETIEKLNKEGKRPRLLLQVCCGPCSTQVIARLREYFDMDLYFYNPMIYPRSELDKRAENLKLVAEKSDFHGKVIIPINDIKDFEEVAKKRKDDKEFGEACYDCYKLRLTQTARLAKKEAYDYFTTTLSISPYKNAQWLNEIGEELEKEYGVKYLYADFKKKDGYKKSIEYSKEYGIYRQEYCGCIFSKKEMEENNC
ncbi:epoxyqueuosine reductase QueH [uncultured Anaerococcus sp.]|uniref:epoxyqueuosine reductase QueH n=1 Tax=uncultured Anaerococcus sp. TaxID=293428 RepID=UPI00288A25CC|nr:epoxyqueuosine reductase QueH [uncultured Anaerococcus sp.]